MKLNYFFYCFFLQIILHRSTDDYGTLLNDVIPLSCLPSDFGGDLESVEVLRKKFRNELCELKKYFSDEEKQWSERLSFEEEIVDENENLDKIPIDCSEID